MPSRKLELTLLNAENLLLNAKKRPNIVGRMSVFAVIRVTGNTKRSTAVDTVGGCNPIWNKTFTFTVPAGVPDDDHEIRINLCCKCKSGNEVISSGHMRLNRILPSTVVPNKVYKWMLTVRSDYCTVQRGLLHFSFKVIPDEESVEKVNKASDSETKQPQRAPEFENTVVPYSPPQPYPYAARPSYYGYGYPPPDYDEQGYGPPPYNRQGYGPRPVWPQTKAPQIDRPGGLGMGFLAGALGALALAGAQTDSDDDEY